MSSETLLMDALPATQFSTPKTVLPVGFENRILDARDAHSLTFFEKAFYRAFCAFPDQTLLRQIWCWNDAQARISLRVPPAEMVLLQLTYQNAPALYLAGTHSEDAFSQFGHFGFQKPSFVSNYSEALVLFSTNTVNLLPAQIAGYFLHPFCYEVARRQGKSHLLATCAPAVLPLYRRWGWEVYNQHTINGAERFFIGKSL